MAWSIVSLEGTASGESGSLVGDATGDIGSSLASDFVLETGRPDTADAYLGAGVWGIAQRIYIEGQTEGQSLDIALLVDNTVVDIGSVSTPAGVKRVMELACHRAGWIHGVRVTASRLTTRIEISAIELDVYVPGG